MPSSKTKRIAKRVASKLKSVEKQAEALEKQAAPLMINRISNMAQLTNKEATNFASKPSIVPGFKLKALDQETTKKLSNGLVTPGYENYHASAFSTPDGRPQTLAPKLLFQQPKQDFGKLAKFGAANNLMGKTIGINDALAQGNEAGASFIAGQEIPTSYKRPPITQGKLFEAKSLIKSLILRQPEQIASLVRDARQNAEIDPELRHALLSIPKSIVDLASRVNPPHAVIPAAMPALHPSPFRGFIPVFKPHPASAQRSLTPPPSTPKKQLFPLPSAAAAATPGSAAAASTQTQNTLHFIHWASRLSEPQLLKLYHDINDNKLLYDHNGSHQLNLDTIEAYYNDNPAAVRNARGKASSKYGFGLLGSKKTGLALPYSGSEILNKMKVLCGEIDAGNNSPMLKNKLDDYLNYCYMKGAIDKSLLKDLTKQYILKK